MWQQWVNLYPKNSGLYSKTLIKKDYTVNVIKRIEAMIETAVENGENASINNKDNVRQYWAGQYVALTLTLKILKNEEQPNEKNARKDAQRAIRETCN